MRQLLILSGKGGTGKTTVAAAFIRLSGASAYADCDVDAPNLHLVFKRNENPQRSDFVGMPKAKINPELCVNCGNCLAHCRFDAILHSVYYEVNPFACEGCGVCQAVCPSGAVFFEPAVPGELMLYKGEGQAFSTALLKMGSGTSGKLVTEVKKQLKEAAPNADLAIIDGSPGIGCPVIASMSGVDLVLLVTEPSLSGISDMKRILKTADIFHTKTAVCINRVDTNPEQSQKIRGYCKEQQIPFVGEIPFDEAVVRANNSGKSIVELDCPAAEAVKTVFRNTMELMQKQEGDNI